MVIVAKKVFIVCSLIDFLDEDLLSSFTYPAARKLHKMEVAFGRRGTLLSFLVITVKRAKLVPSAAVLLGFN